MASFYARFFAEIYDKVLASSEEYVLAKKRYDLLHNLKGDVLEVGSGTGTNFQYYTSSAKVKAIEPSLPMLEKSLPKGTHLDNIEVEQKGLYDLDETLQKYDAIVCTLVLCTIPDLDKAIKKIKSLLKEDGELIILEHIHAEKRGKRLLMNSINPLWKIIGEGCNLNRSTDETLKSNGFAAKWEHYFEFKLRWYEGVFVLREIS